MINVITKDPASSAAVSLTKIRGIGGLNTFEEQHANINATYVTDDNQFGATLLRTAAPSFALRPQRRRLFGNTEARRQQRGLAQLCAPDLRLTAELRNLRQISPRRRP